jgi:hypothetical protein
MPRIMRGRLLATLIVSLVSLHLHAGIYEVRFRTTDVRGNRTRHPKRHVVRVH